MRRSTKTDSNITAAMNAIDRFQGNKRYKDVYSWRFSINNGRAYALFTMEMPIKRMIF